MTIIPIPPQSTVIWFDKNQFIIAPIIGRVIGYPPKYGGARMELATVRRMANGVAGIDYKEVLSKNVFTLQEYMAARKAIVPRKRRESLKQYRFRLLYWLIERRAVVCGQP